MANQISVFPVIAGELPEYGATLVTAAYCLWALYPSRVSLFSSKPMPRPTLEYRIIIAE